ncbi:MAG: tetratricopeptide repeat protein [Alphaproteobacteria bacterium]|nr:tetratricopeptide repeat protein [Alphaproteobacteria bacterium]
MSALWLLWWGLACDGGCAGGPLGSDAVLDDQVAAAAAWDQGQALLEAGDAAAAADAFARAAALDPASPSLLAWRARALERAGDLLGALAVLDEGVERFPDDLDLRFNRAALRARDGDLDGAARDLEAARECCGLLPEVAGADPDLALLRADPRHAGLVLPPGPVVMARGEEGSVLLGEPYEVELLVAHGAELSLGLESMGQASGLLTRERVVEHHMGEEDGRRGVRLDLRWRCVQAGEGLLGPWLVLAGGASTLTEPLPVRCVSVGGRDGTEPGAAREAAVLPSQHVGAHRPPWMGELDGRFAVLLPPGATVDARDASGAALRSEEHWELRERDRTVWEVELFERDRVASARILQAGSELLVGAP